MPLAGLVSFISSKLGHRVSRLVQKLVVATPPTDNRFPPRQLTTVYAAIISYHTPGKALVYQLDRTSNLREYC
eukprot:scaffold114_cov200-Alexandrium_tamarense.AAC.61